MKVEILASDPLNPNKFITVNVSDDPIVIRNYHDVVSKKDAGRCEFCDMPNEKDAKKCEFCNAPLNHFKDGV